MLEDVQQHCTLLERRGFGQVGEHMGGEVTGDERG